MNPLLNGRLAEAASLALQHALDEARSALTPQEGLYRAYMGYLRDVDQIEGLPDSLQTAIHELLVELTDAFGISNFTGAKVGASTLEEGRARLLVERLGAIEASTHALTMRAGSHHDGCER